MSDDTHDGSHFPGDPMQVVNCSKRIIELVSGGDYVSVELHNHIAWAYGNANTLRGTLLADSSFSGTVDDVNCTNLDDCFSQLESALPEVQGGAIAAPGGVDYFRIVQLVLELIKLLRS